MEEVDHKSIWWRTMIAKHGSEEAVRAFMRQSAETSKRNKRGTGGFAALQKSDPVRHKQLSAKGGRAHAHTDTTIKSSDESVSGGAVPSEPQ